MKVLSRLNPALRFKNTDIPLATPLLAIYVAVGLLFAPAFTSNINITSILFSVAAVSLTKHGMQLLLLLGRFDLSMGATASLSGMVAGLSLMRYNSIALAVCLALLVGFTVGWLTGLLVTRFRVDPLIATLSVLGVTRSLSLVVNDGRIVAGLPSNFGWLVQTRVAGIPFLILFALVCTFVAGMLTRHAVVFRKLRGVGDNPKAALHSGLNVKALMTFGYILAGLGAALTGLLQASRTLSASPLQFQTLAIEAIAACLIGGSALTGGRGGVFGAAIGLIVVCATNNLVIILGISVYWKECGVGLLLLLAVLGSPLTNRIKGLLIKRKVNTTTQTQL